MTNEYELADDDREKLIWTKEQLLVPLLETMEAPPHPMRLGNDEKDYYRLGGAGVSPTGRAPGMSGPGGISGPAMEATATRKRVPGESEVKPGAEQASYSGQEAEL
jgi:NADH-quinone oxidoreductase subunit I